MKEKEIKEPEYNNGWIKLNGVAGEITHNGDLFIINKKGDIEIVLEDEFLELGYATYYQPIEKPKPPIY